MDENWLRPDEISIYRLSVPDEQKAGTSSRTPDSAPRTAEFIPAYRRAETPGCESPSAEDIPAEVDSKHPPISAHSDFFRQRLGPAVGVQP